MEIDRFGSGNVTPKTVVTLLKTFAVYQKQ